jgi:hypothetical protein
VHEWRRRDTQPITELICAESSGGYFNYDVRPVPTALHSDF